MRRRRATWVGSSVLARVKRFKTPNCASLRLSQEASVGVQTGHVLQQLRRLVNAEFQTQPIEHRAALFLQSRRDVDQAAYAEGVLEIIGGEETYGYAITRRLNELGFADVVEGTVYTILLRLEKNGLVQVTKRPSGMGPPRKFYALNDAGREELATFWGKWEYLSSRIDQLKEGGR